ncbi:uncharacterized protein FTOL_11804 [Fusarium torulosum]|uniref:Uncharacterized protein n=1 Tax=Fusarium torulosum TaxID=33205 RepID=A0AAE8SNS6_9HYPO|nr:uncharacterized protein FTOL_11804 [Fusarium torulosum]
MASNTLPLGGPPPTTNSAPPGASNVQPAASNTSQAATNPQPAPRGQRRARASSDAESEEKVELLTDPWLRRLEATVANHVPTDTSLESLGVKPEDYEKDENLLAGIWSGPEVALDEIEDHSGTKKRVKLGSAYANARFGGKDLYKPKDDMDQLVLSLKHTSFDIITALCCNLELAIEIGKHLPPKDIVNLYIASAAFRKAVKGHMLSCIRMWIDTKAPEAGEVFHWKLYGKMLIRDPVARTSDADDARNIEGRWETAKTNPGKIRLIPGFKYLQLVLGRDQYCREILAMMARMGFLMPKTMYSTLLRLWLLLDISTSRQRQLFLRNQDYWTEDHLYNVQFFLVKLSMAFTHPYFHPHSIDMVRLMMGQKGLFPLWQLLMRQKYTTISEIMTLKARYDLRLSRAVWRGIQKNKWTTAYGVPIREIGRGHREGWGKGLRHLGRPDELIPVEAVVRGLYLDDHITQMMVWGYIDFGTGENIVPTEEDIYISDEEEKLGKTDRTHHWQRKHALKKRWAELTPEQQQEIKDDDNDEHLRAMAWSSVDNFNFRGDWESESEAESEGEYDLNAEIDRGYRMPAVPKEKSTANTGDSNNASDINMDTDNIMGLYGENLYEEGTQAWQTLYTTFARNTVPEVTPEEAQRARAWADWLAGGSVGAPPHENWSNNPQPNVASDNGTNAETLADQLQAVADGDEDDEDEEGAEGLGYGEDPDDYEDSELSEDELDDNGYNGVGTWYGGN